jgi:peptidyl-prolyl cis-trans isomerase SurA
MAKLKAGGDFAQLARNYSEVPTAAQGGDLGQFRRGTLAKVLEDATFSLKTGQYTEPIRTKQGYVILKVTQHIPGGVPEFKDVEQDVEQSYYESKMMPAMRDYLTKMREDAYVEIKPGYTDTGASGNQRVLPITYSSYTPPTPKKKKKVERTRFRETTHTFRQKSPATVAPEAAAADSAATAAQTAKSAPPAPAPSMKPGKKEKIRYGQAPTKTLPAGPEAPIEDAGATPQVAANAEPENPLETAPPEKKTRYSERAKQPKEKKPKGPQVDPLAPAPPDASEVSDRQAQSAPLGLGGDTASSKKKKASTTTGDKTRYSDRNRPENQPQTQAPPPEPTPIPAVPGAPAPSQTPTPAPQPQQ